MVVVVGFFLHVLAFSLIIAARILVNPNPGAERGYKDGKFIVHDLDSALRIAKDGDVIFLEAGTFTPKQPELSDATVYGESDAAAKKKKAAFEIKKGVTIVGCSTSKAIISGIAEKHKSHFFLCIRYFSFIGSLVKWGPGTVSFRRLKIEVGVDSDSVDDVYLLDGATELVNCVIESFVNTCFYVISSPTLLSGSTRLLFKHCILNGMDKCRRMICFQVGVSQLDHISAVTNNCCLPGFSSHNKRGVLLRQRPLLLYHRDISQ